MRTGHVGRCAQPDIQVDERPGGVARVVEALGERDGRAVALVLDDEATGDDAPKEAPDPFAAIDASWQPILVKHKSAGDGTALVKALDSAKEYDEGVIDGHEAHSTPLLCLASTSPDLVDDLKQSPMLYQDMIRQLLNSLRLFSFTTRPEPPKEKK